MKQPVLRLLRQLVLPKPSCSAQSCSYRYYAAESQTALIRQLREKSSAPMKDVKAALVQCDWDLEAAFTELRKKGLAGVNKKASRLAKEGLLALSQKPGVATIIELNSETDFVARNDIFQHLAHSVANAALSMTDESCKALSKVSPVDLQALESVRVKMDHPKLSGEATVQEAIQEAAAIMGENLKLRRGFSITAKSGIIASYLHMSPQPGLGKTAGLLALNAKEGSLPVATEVLNSIGRNIAMHIVDAQPLFLTKDDITDDVWERERNIILSQVAGSDKPEAVLKKMVEGRLRKYSEEVVLLEQKYLMNDKMTVRGVIEDLSKQAGAPIEIGCYVRLDVGESVDREESATPVDVAAQVA